MRTLRTIRGVLPGGTSCRELGFTSGSGQGLEITENKCSFLRSKSEEQRQECYMDTSVSNRHPQAACGLFISPKIPMGQERFTAIDQMLRAERTASQRQLLGLRP